MITEIVTRALSADFKNPNTDRYFEDYVQGSVYEYGTITLSEQEIIDFAVQFDPQPIHIDRAFATAGPFKGIIASGWHTSGVMMRLLALHYLSKVASLASPGGEDLRWNMPVRPGDALRLRTTILEARQSKTKPDRGIVKTKAEILNQNDQVVMSIVAMNMIGCRPKS